MKKDWVLNDVRLLRQTAAAIKLSYEAFKFETAESIDTSYFQAGLAPA